MLAVNLRQINTPAIANTREKDFYTFVRRADIEELRAQRAELAACLESESAKALSRVHNAIVATMRDRLEIIDRSIAVSLN